MEKTAAEILWTNSVDKHNLRYTTMFLMEFRAHMRPPVCLESVWWWCGDTQRRMCETRRETNRDCAAQSHKDVKEDWCISRRTRTWQTYKGCHQKASSVLQKGNLQLHRWWGCYVQSCVLIFLPRCVNWWGPTSPSLPCCGCWHQQLVLLPACSGKWWGAGLPQGERPLHWLVTWLNKSKKSTCGSVIPNCRVAVWRARPRTLTSPFTQRCGANA